MRSAIPFFVAFSLSAPCLLAQGFYTGRQTLALGADAYSPTLSANELSLIFASRRTGGKGGYDLWETTRSAIGASWTTPVNLAALNTTADEYEPTLNFGGSAGSSELFFVRRQPSLAASTILQSVRTTSGWSVPVPAAGLPAPDTIPLDDPYLTSDGLTLFYTETAVNNGDIYTVNRASQTSPWKNRTPFTVANSAGVDRSPMPEGDGGVVFFSRAPGTGPADIWVTWRNRTGPYATPVPVADVNSSSSERNGHLGATTRRLYLSIDPTGTTAHVDEYCPVPNGVAIAGRASGTLGSTFPTTPPPAPYFAKSYVFGVAIGSTVAVGWRDWRIPPPPPEVGLLFFSAIAIPPNIVVPGFRGAFNLDPTFFVSFGAFPVTPDGTVTTLISVPNDASLRGVSVQFQLVHIALSPRTGAFSHLAWLDLR